MERGLLRRAFSVAVERPSLLLPALVADVLAFGLDSLWAVVIWILVRWQLQPLRHPVRPLEHSGLPTLVRIMPLIGGTFRLGSTFVDLLAYTVALLTTAGLFRAGSRVRLFAGVAAATKVSRRPVIVFCLKLLGLLAGASTLLALIYALGENRLFIATTEVTTLFSTLAFAVVSFIVSPAAYRLLERQGALPLSKQDAKSLGLTAAACVLAAGLAYWGGTWLENRFLPVFKPYSVYILASGIASLLVSIIAAVPYGLMFISFAVLSASPALDLNRIGTAAITEGTRLEAMHSPPPPDALA